MPELTYESRDTVHDYGTFELMMSMDKDVREMKNELYMFRRETSRDISEVKQKMTEFESSEIRHDKNISILQNDVSELKEEVKELRHDMSEIKGDIKAISAGFGAAQSRFNWALVILGLFVALIQLLK